MLDIQMIRTSPDIVSKALLKKGVDVDFSTFLAHDRLRREHIVEVEALKAKKNTTSADIPRMKKEGRDVTVIFEQMKDVAQKIRELDEIIASIEIEQKAFLDALPNLPADDVVAGGKENNEVVRHVGQKPSFDFTPKHHVDIAQDIGLIDYVRAAKLSGAGYWIYTGDGARMEWALLNYFIEEHLGDGYQMVMLPHMLTYACGYTAGQFPKFTNEVYHIKDDEKPEGFSHFLLPTAETALVNLHRDEILDESDLPKRYFAYSPCYRKEAGSYRAEERGMIRGHQFNKVELFQYTLPEKSEQALEEMIDKAAKLVTGLGLHYRISKLAAEDCSAAMRKTYDIEVWIPSMGDYKEVSSASNAGDYQARRGQIRCRKQGQKQLEPVHTLNASGLATSRIFPAILEQCQQADGTVLIPEVLRKWMGHKTHLGA